MLICDSITTVYLENIPICNLTKTCNHVGQIISNHNHRLKGTRAQIKGRMGIKCQTRNEAGRRTEGQTCCNAKFKGLGKGTNIIKRQFSRTLKSKQQQDIPDSVTHHQYCWLKFYLKNQTRANVSVMSVILSRNDLDCRSLQLSAADDTEVKSEVSSLNRMDNLDEESGSDLHKDGQFDSSEDEVQYFKEFLNKVQNCLAGRSRQTGTRWKLG